MGNETKKPDEITDSITTPNIKSLAEQPAMLNNLAHANLIGNDSLAQQNAVSWQAQTPPQMLADVQIAGVTADIKAPQPPIQPQPPATAAEEMERLRIEVEKLKKK